MSLSELNLAIFEHFRHGSLYNRGQIVLSFVFVAKKITVWYQDTVVTCKEQKKKLGQNVD